MPANHADTQPLSKRVGGSFRTGAVYGSLTNTIVAAGDTLDLLAAGIRTAGAALHADHKPHTEYVARAVYRDQNVTTSAVAGLTTVDGLVALTDLGSGTRGDLLAD